MTNENKINTVLYNLSNSITIFELEDNNINIDSESLKYNIYNETDTINKINLIKQSLSKINHFQSNSNNQKNFLKSNNNLSKKINKDLQIKNNILSSKQTKFMIEYDKIEELERNIEKNKKIINKYLTILKYLIPILILIIILFIVLQSNSLF